MNILRLSDLIFYCFSIISSHLMHVFKRYLEKLIRNIHGYLRSILNISLAILFLKRQINRMLGY